MSLDKKLKGIFIKWYNVARNDDLTVLDKVALESDAVEQVKQAFIDEGWMKLDEVKNMALKAIDELGENIRKEHNCMTGPEWLARFEKELNKVRVYGDQTEDLMVDRPEVVKAARRASGSGDDDA